MQLNFVPPVTFSPKYQREGLRVLASWPPLATGASSRNRYPRYYGKNVTSFIRDRERRNVLTARCEVVVVVVIGRAEREETSSCGCKDSSVDQGGGGGGGHLINLDDLGQQVRPWTVRTGCGAPQIGRKSDHGDRPTDRPTRVENANL